MGDEAHLTVAPVRYQLHGSPRAGVASTQIADRLEMGATIPVYIQKNPHFRLPGDEVPIIMIGRRHRDRSISRLHPGARGARAAAGRSWLFFGERNLRSDFLYQIELQHWLKDGVPEPSRCRFFARRTRESLCPGASWRRLAISSHGSRQGASLYVCGDEKAMGRDVHETLTRSSDAKVA